MNHSVQTQYNISLMLLFQAKANLLRITWNGTWKMAAIAGTVSVGYWLDLVHRYGWWAVLVICGGFVLYSWIAGWRQYRNTPWWMMLTSSYHVAVPDDCDWEAALAMSKQLKGICVPYEPFGMAFSNKRSAMTFKLIHGGQ